MNMRMTKRAIGRQMILESTPDYEIIEAYPEDKYLPSYLVWARHRQVVFHILFAADVRDGNVRVVTAYQPDPECWSDDLKTRRQS
ncbi:MAG: DUF4258 domain-containing protein [Pseudomonadota bacterium]